MSRGAFLSEAGAAPPGFAHCTPEALRESDPFDFVVSGDDARKVTSHPTFRLLDDPSDALRLDAAARSRRVSYDGFLVADATRLAEARASLTALGLASPLVEAAGPDGLFPASERLLACWRENRQSRTARFGQAIIDVVMRTGGRDEALLHRAVISLARQAAGALRLVLVRHGETDTDKLQTLQQGALKDITVVDAPGANRARAMAAGLAAVRAPRFALLDDDDYLLEDHFLHLLEASETVSAPALAYADILALDESEAGGGLSLWREGVATAPLGAVTNRISAHAFLAETGALQGVRFDNWALATAEDALLIASLLVQAHPVHSPHATCVYAMGRGDGSAYLAHPDRAQDELAFAREIAPNLSVIERKFAGPKSEPATFLDPFLSAARRASLFTELRRQGDDANLGAIRHDAPATLAQQDETLATHTLTLRVEPIDGAARDLPGGAVAVTAARDYAYAAAIQLDEPADLRPLVIAVEARASGCAFGLALVDDTHAIISEAVLEPLPTILEVQLAWNRPASPRLVVRRLHSLGQQTSELFVHGLSLAYASEQLAPGGDEVEAQAVLASLAAAPRLICSPKLSSELSGVGHPLPLSADGATRMVIDLGAAPWAYATVVELPRTTPAGIRVQLRDVAAPVFVLRVDEAWEQVGERLEAPASASGVDLLLEPVDACGPLRLVLQAGAAPGGRKVTLSHVLLYAADGEGAPQASAR